MQNEHRGQYVPPEKNTPQIASILEGKRVELFIDGRPISHLTTSSEQYHESGTERVYVAFETTVDAVNSPDISAQYTAAMMGFHIGDSAAIRYSAKHTVSGVVTIEELLHSDDADIPTVFLAKALTPIFVLNGNAAEIQYKAGELLRVEPRFCERFKS